MKLDHYDLVEAVKRYYGSKQGYFIATEVDTPFPGIGRVDVVGFCISGTRPIIRCFECETEIRDIAKIRGKFTQLKKIATHVYLVVPRYVYDANLDKIVNNIILDGFGTLSVNENGNLSENNESKIFNPEMKWNELLNKLIDKYPQSSGNIARAFKKFCEYFGLL